MTDLKDMIVTQGEEQTIKFAAEFARMLRKGDIVALHGDLGAGKSVFCRSVIRALCGNPELEVPSPTYTIVQNYEGETGVISHFDLYRLGAPEEIYEIGWEEFLHHGIVLIEWPSRLGNILPAARIDVTLSDVPNIPNHRKIEIRRYEL